MRTNLYWPFFYHICSFDWWPTWRMACPRARDRTPQQALGWISNASCQPVGTLKRKLGDGNCHWLIPPSFRMISSISILRWKASGLIKAKVPCNCKSMDHHTHHIKTMHGCRWEFLRFKWVLYISILIGVMMDLVTNTKYCAFFSEYLDGYFGEWRVKLHELNTTVESWMHI